MEINQIRSVFHSLPDFIIIGAQRCGTTSLFNYLNKHPLIISPTKKEIHFFNDNYSKGIPWYKSHFPTYYEKLRTLFRYQIIALTGEATPYYIFHKLAPSRIHKLLPDVKLLALLRNPVDRAYSHYIHIVNQNLEPLPFCEAIRIEKNRLKGEANDSIPSHLDRDSIQQKYSYLSRGIYVDQLVNYFKLFSNDNIMIINSEKFFSNPLVSLEKVYKFLKIPFFNQNNFKIFNQNQYPDIDSDTRLYLVEYFKPHNERLYQLLGLTFDWDK